MIERKRPPSHPGKVLKGLYLEPFNIKIVNFAKLIGVSRKTLSKILNEKGSVTPDMALRLSMAFKTSPEVWLNLQRNYDLWHAEHVSNDWKNVKSVEPKIDIKFHN
ncbi:MAG: HigA family addiction module antidote protein [Desulfobacterales bacterium]|nr:HigA family addiction module antidote protein [Desulfobacterales bacterium]